jgi:hypothetical protein
MVKSWLKLFRVVNLPTIPGDILVGTALAYAFNGIPFNVYFLILAIITSVLLYLYGLIDNDIAGAAKDTDRPIANGEISQSVARVVRSFIFVGVVGVAVKGCLPKESLYVVMAMLLSIVAYNRTKSPVLMGLCRALNVVFAITCQMPLFTLKASCGFYIAFAAVVAVWFAYIAAVTKYSKGEEVDGEKRALVGRLVGGIIYLQLTALIVCSMVNGQCNVLLIVALAMLFIMRIVRRFMPFVSAS